MERYYNINYSLLIMLLTPVSLRNEAMSALLMSLMRPMDSLNSDFREYAQSRITQINAQVCFMQAMLNNEFDYYDRRIRIRTTEIDIDSYLLWQESQNKPQMISKETSDNHVPYLLNRDSQIGANTPDFDIVFPVGYALTTTESRRVRILVNRHKLASKKYQIVYE